MRVNHTATENLYPTGMFTEVTSLTTTDVTRDIHLCTWLSEWEIAWTQTNLGVSTKHLASKCKENLLQVGKADILVNIQTFYLMEETVCTCADGLVTIYTTRAKYTDRWLVGLHIVSLITRRMTAQENVLGHIVRVALLNEESILHIAGWMISGKVEHGENMLVIVNLWTMIEGKAHARENVDNLILDNCQWMTGTESYRVGGTCQVNIIAGCISLFHLLLESVDAFCNSLLQLIDLYTNCFLLVGWHCAEVGHKGINRALLAQILESELLYFFCILSRKSAHFLQEFFYFF